MLPREAIEAHVCRLYGFRSAVPSKAHRSLAEAENALARQSVQHPDGWGIGWFVDDDAYVVRSANAAHACERFRKISATLSSHTMIGHVRRATVGTIDHLNAHPFRYGRWVFAHNGTIFSFDALRGWLDAGIDEGFRPLILGDTDSEHLFYFLLSAMADNGVDRSGRRPSDAKTVGHIVRQALAALDEEAVSRGLERPITNLLLTDGRVFVAHKAGMPLFLSSQAHHLQVASEPIGSEENDWVPVEDGATVVLDEQFTLEFLAPPVGWVQPPIPERYRRPPAPKAAASTS